MSEKQHTLQFKGLLSGVRDEEIDGNKFKVHSIVSRSLGNFDAWLKDDLVGNVPEENWTDYGLPVLFTVKVQANRNKLGVKLVEMVEDAE